MMSASRSTSVRATALRSNAKGSTTVIAVPHGTARADAAIDGQVRVPLRAQLDSARPGDNLRVRSRYHVWSTARGLPPASPPPRTEIP
jgi:hypothetical protein